MKLYYDKRLADPTYYAQQGIRIGKKTTTRNVKKFGKHSELLKITDDPLSYVRKEIEKMNEEYRVGKVSFDMTVNFNEKVRHTDEEASSSNSLNIGYFFLQEVMKGLLLKQFFEDKTADRKITYDCYTIARFLVYARVLRGFLPFLPTARIRQIKISFSYILAIRTCCFLQHVFYTVPKGIRYKNHVTY